MDQAKNLAVITGTSAGIGLALAQKLLDEGWHVVGLARRPAPIAREEYTHLAVDLSELDHLRTVVVEALRPRLEESDLGRIALVNNAAMIGALARLREADPQRLGRLFAVNTVAPLFLMGFVAQVVPSTVELRIVNISSGAAHTPLPGLADYCASKAALRLAGRTLAAEFARDGRTPREAAVFSFEPGLVDTAMQDQARDTSPDAFPAHEAFRSFHDEGLLNAPDAVVGDILDFLTNTPRESFSERRFGED